MHDLVVRAVGVRPTNVLFFRLPQKVLLEVPEIKNQGADSLDLSWESDDWTLFFELFKTEDIGTNHQKFSSYSPQNRGQYGKYCEMSASFLAAMNKCAVALLTDGVLLSGDTPNASSPRSSDYVLAGIYR